MALYIKEPLLIKVCLVMTFILKTPYKSGHVPSLAPIPNLRFLTITS